MKEDNEEDFSKYEDDIIIIFNKLSTTIDTLNTLSRDQAEKAILETNLKINNCKEILDKMEQYLKEEEDGEDINKTELNKKLLNYKTEYQELLNKFNDIQENYISRKTENALLEKENDKNLIDEDENKNKDKKNKKGEQFIIDGELDEKIKKNNNNEQLKEIENKKDKNINNNKNDVTLISVSNNNNILDHNNSQVLNYSLNPKVNMENDEAFNQITKDYNIKKRKTVLICVAICLFIFVIIILSATLSRK
jgi:hypothetical protein